MAQRLWHSWRHGALICVVVALGAALGVICVALPAYLMLALAGVDEVLTAQIILLLALLWIPLGVGLVARTTSFDELKPKRSEG